VTAEAAALDAQDALAPLRKLFKLNPATSYLDGNSLGALPLGVIDAVQRTVSGEWGDDLIASWNTHNWIDLPVTVGEKIAPLIGAQAGQVLCVDSISINLFKLLSTGLALRPERRVILTLSGDFPTDAYMAQGLAQLLGPDRCELRRVSADRLHTALDTDVAVLMLTQVNYRSGECYDMAALTRAAHEAGAVVLWDLAHSAGVVPLALDALGVDMAVGCGYKYFNGGPGAPAFVYLNRRHHDVVQQPLSGWLGHSQAFEFSPDYLPAPGVRAFQAGTPPIISMVALNAALDVFAHTSVAAIRDKSLALTEHFRELLQERGLLERLECLTPEEPERRGSQISLRHDQAWGMSQALIEAGVIVDFRAPDILRFGFAPLYNSFADAVRAADTLADIVREERYADARYSKRPAVT
jgi:kynureninase